MAEFTWQKLNASGFPYESQGNVSLPESIPDGAILVWDSEVGAWMPDDMPVPGGPRIVYTESKQMDVTSSTTPQPKINWTTPSLDTGTYKLDVSYSWSHDSSNDDFLSELIVNGVRPNLVGGPMHQSEPSDSAGTFLLSGTNQKFAFFKTYFVSLPVGSSTILLNYWAESPGNASSIWDANITLTKVA